MDLYLVPDLRALVVQLTERVREECASLAPGVTVEPDPLKNGVVVYWEDGPALSVLRPRLEALGMATSTVSVVFLPPIVENMCLVRVGRAYSHRATALGVVLWAQGGLPAPPALSTAAAGVLQRPWTTEALERLEDVDEYSFDTFYNYTRPLAEQVEAILDALDLSPLPALPSGVDPSVAVLVDVVERLSADAATTELSDLLLWMVSGGYELALSLAHPLATATSPAGS